MTRTAFPVGLVTALALLAVCAPAKPTEPATVRITTWNLQWFPSGSAHEASAEQQNQRIKEAADVLKSVRHTGQHSPASAAWRAKTEELLIIIALCGPRPIVTRSSTSSYVVPLIMSFGSQPMGLWNRRCPGPGRGRRPAAVGRPAGLRIGTPPVRRPSED
jgi:hypothetical protein